MIRRALAMLWGAPLLLLMLASTGCNSGSAPVADGGSSTEPAAPPTVFSLAWSEYPSWSVFGVADEANLVDKDKGELGILEEKWNVDLVLEEKDYDTCITMYGTGTVDAVCITNMDILAPALGRESVAILPTSTSDGADACIVAGIESIDDLKGVTSYGLEKSVSQYTFERNLELLGKDAADYPFKNMDPAAAAQAVQTNQENIQSIVVWNPFVLQTLRTRDGTKVLFDSTTIPEEIIDMVAVSKDSLAKEGGAAFAHLVIETFYEVNRMLASPSQGDTTLQALGAKFSTLPLEDMKIVVQQTKFYKSPAEALALFNSESFQNTTMPKVVDFCLSHEIVDKKPSVGFGAAGAQLNFDPAYIEAVAAQRKD